jgi:hypothetical protein
LFGKHPEESTQDSFSNREEPLVEEGLDFSNNNDSDSSITVKPVAVSKKK